MNDLDEFELYFEVYVTNPYKRQEKEETIMYLQNQMTNFGCKSVSTKDSYNIIRHSEAAMPSFVVILQVIATLSSATIACLTIKDRLAKTKRRGSVILKDKTGKSVKINEEMTAEEAREKLNEKEKEG